MTMQNFKTWNFEPMSERYSPKLPPTLEYLTSVIGDRKKHSVEDFRGNSIIVELGILDTVLYAGSLK